MPRVGFTLIELMVVIAIIVMAAGLMTPTITDFFKTRQLEGLRGQLVGAFNSARLKAVNEGIRTSLVFFREGIRTYDEKRKEFFNDELWSPEGSPLSGDQMWLVLGFLGGRTSFALPRYRIWEQGQQSQVTDSRSDARAASDSKKKFNVASLPRIIFERDGSLTFASGADVKSYLKEPIPSNADIIVYQANNTTACFVDLRLPGQLRSKMIPIGRIPQRPEEGEEASGTGTTAVRKR